MDTIICPIEEELEKMLGEVFSNDDRTKMVMRRHNGFNGNAREKLEDIAKDINVTKEAVRQRSIKGLGEIVEFIQGTEVDSHILPTLRYAEQLLTHVTPCTESDAQTLLFNETVTERRDLDIDALLYLLEAIGFRPSLTVVKEGGSRFVVPVDTPKVIQGIVKHAREEVTRHGGANTTWLARTLNIGHQRLINQIRITVAALESQSDFVWLSEDYVEVEGTRQRTGFFLLKNAGRNPVVMRLKRIFSVRYKNDAPWLHAKIARSFKAMKRECTLPPEVIAQIGIEQGICKRDSVSPMLIRKMKLAPEDTIEGLEYDIWKFLKENPYSKDADIMKACMKVKRDKFNIRSKLNFSVVIQRVEHGIYNAVTDDYPE